MPRPDGTNTNLTGPNVCAAPNRPQGIPIPYPNIANSSNVSNTGRTVKIEGAEEQEIKEDDDGGEEEDDDDDDSEEENQNESNPDIIRISSTTGGSCCCIVM